MQNHYRVIFLLSTLLLLPICSLWAQEGDLARELRLRDEIVDMILDGDPITLNTGEREFLGILTEADEPKAGVLILHGRGFHPDWQDAVNPLRVGLAENGWTTLSLQMPVLEKDAKYYDYVPIFGAATPRIEAGIAELRDLGYEKIVLIAHSCGVHMAMHWVDTVNPNSIDAYVGLGMGATDYKQFMEKPFPLDRMSIPVLDLYGENDFPAVIKMAPERLSLIAKGGNIKSVQKSLPYANHYFTDEGDALVGVVSGWLDTLGFQSEE